MKVDRAKESKVEKILNKRKIKEIVKYLVWWKRFTAEHDSWEIEENLKNIKKMVVEFKERLNAEVK